MTNEDRFELVDNTEQKLSFDVRELICCETIRAAGYTIVPCTPATGTLFITDDNPGFVSGQARMRGKNEGRYPFHYLDMIDSIFGYEPNTIEVCSRSVPGGNKGGHCFTVDINPDCKPDLVTNGETLEGIESETFDRWRCDPPYNEKTAIEMYGTNLPKTSELLKAGARVCKEGALMFLLLGPTNYQSCPPGVVRIGSIALSIIPNNEWRTLNIFLKIGDADPRELLKHRRRPKPRNQSLFEYNMATR